MSVRLCVKAWRWAGSVRSGMGYECMTGVWLRLNEHMRLAGMLVPACDRAGSLECMQCISNVV